MGRCDEGGLSLPRIQGKQYQDGRGDQEKKEWGASKI